MAIDPDAYSAVDLKAATPDSSVPSGALIFGADSQSAAAPSVYPLADLANALPFTQSGEGAVARTAQDKLRDVVSVKDFSAAGDGVTDDTAAFNAASASLVDGGTLLIPPGEYRLDSAWSVLDKTFNIDCHGTVLLTDDAGSLIEFKRTPTVVAGTDIVLPEAGDEALAWNSAPSVGDPSAYFFTLKSTEEEIVRIGQTYYTPFTKNEANGISSYDWKTRAPILFTYTDASKLTVSLYAKGAPVTIRGLKIRLLAGAASSKTQQVVLEGVSNVAFEGLEVDCTDLNVPGQAVRLDSCYGLTFRNCTTIGPNSQSGDSYSFLAWISAFLSFHDCENRNATGASSPRIGRGYTARHASHVSFHNCRFNGIDDHYGFHYEVVNCKFVSLGVLFAGGWITLRDCVGSASNPLFMLRTETPYAIGQLLMENCSSRGMLIQFRVAFDSLGRPTKVKFFDSVVVSNCTSNATDLGTFRVIPPPVELGHTFTKTGLFRVVGLTFHRTMLETDCAIFNLASTMTRSFVERAEFVDIKYNLDQFTSDSGASGYLIADLRGFHCDSLYIRNWDDLTLYLTTCTSALIVDSIVGVNRPGASDQLYFGNGDWTFQNCILNAVPSIQSGAAPTINVIGCILWKNFFFRLTSAAKYVGASVARAAIGLTALPSGTLQAYISADYKDS